jgi:hypothetical protein
MWLDDGYRMLCLLLASLALVPTLWATSLIDRAWRAPVEPASAPKRLMALLVRKPHVQPITKSDAQLAGLMTAEDGSVDNVSSHLPDEMVSDVTVVVNRAANSCEKAA